VSAEAATRFPLPRLRIVGTVRLVFEHADAGFSLVSVIESAL
jgi:hypothetical protein